MRNRRLNGSHAVPALAGFVWAFAGVVMLFGPVVMASEDAERGQKSYVQFCQGCHGADKAGLVNFSGGLDDLQAILDGETNQMPDFYGVFSEDEVADIFAFLKADG